MIKVGKIFTIAGRYKRRSFWHWLKKEPRELQQFVVKANYTSGDMYEEKKQ